MTAIHGLGGPAPANTGRRVRQGTSFRLDEAASNTEAPATAAAGPVNLCDLLAMQETDPETVRDRAARRHGQSMLDLLRALQHAALADRAAVGDTTLARLADLIAAVPPADNPGLQATLRAIGVRAAVELARRHRA